MSLRKFCPSIPPLIFSIINCSYYKLLSESWGKNSQKEWANPTSGWSFRPSTKDSWDQTSDIPQGELFHVCTAFSIFRKVQNSQLRLWGASAIWPTERKLWQSGNSSSTIYKVWFRGISMESCVRTSKWGANVTHSSWSIYWV